MIRVVQVCCALAALAGLCGCESTVDAAKKITAKGTAAFKARGLSVTQIDRQIKVVHSAVLQDANGAAVVIDVRNLGHEPVIAAPIAINVRDKHGRSVFENNTAGLEASLAHLPLLLPGQVFAWVNDQVQPSGTPVSVVVRIGPGASAHSAPPPIQVSDVKVTNDPVSGAEASGKVRNASSVIQTHLVLYAVGRKGSRVVAAGRAIVTRLLPHKTTDFHVFFIGNPTGAQVSVAAPPSVL